MLIMDISIQHVYSDRRHLRRFFLSRSEAPLIFFASEVQGFPLLLTKITGLSRSTKTFPGLRRSLAILQRDSTIRHETFITGWKTRQDKTMVRNGCRHWCLYIRILVIH